MALSLLLCSLSCLYLLEHVVSVGTCQSLIWGEGRSPTLISRQQQDLRVQRDTCPGRVTVHCCQLRAAKHRKVLASSTSCCGSFGTHLLGCGGVVHAALHYPCSCSGVCCIPSDCCWQRATVSTLKNQLATAAAARVLLRGSHSKMQTRCCFQTGFELHLVRILIVR
jgi:hypothetical protein